MPYPTFPAPPAPSTGGRGWGTSWGTLWGLRNAGLRGATLEELETLMAPRQGVWLYVEVQDADGVWRDLTRLGGRNWVMQVQIDTERVDQPVGNASVYLRREAPLGDSLAPLMSASPFNQLPPAEYAPLLDIGVPIRISTLVLPAGELPSSVLTSEDGDILTTEDDEPLSVGDRVPRRIFDGRIDKVAWHEDPIAIACSDLGAWLMDTQIEETRVYGSESGTPVETVMQEILDDWPSVLGPVTLHVPASPGWLIREYEQDRVRVLEAIRQLAQQIGWELRYRYDAAGVFRLTLFSPDRENTDPLWSIGPQHYYDVRGLEVRLDDIRNVVAVPFFLADGTPQLAVAQDTPSIGRVGRRFMEIQEADTSNIDTMLEATRLAQAAVHDLATPPVEKELEMDLFWPAQEGDVYEFAANGVHYDESQRLAVVGVRHEFAAGSGRTTLQLRGRVAGAYRDWLAKEKNSGRDAVPEIRAWRVLQADHAFVYWEGGPFVVLNIDGGPEVAPATSPIRVARPAAGAEHRTYRFTAFAIRGRAERSVEVEIPPQTSGLIPTLSGISTADTTFPGDGGGSVDISWSEANLPGGTTIDLEYEITEGNSDFANPPTGTRTNIGPSPYTLSHAMGPDAPSGRIRLIARNGSDEVTRAETGIIPFAF